MGKKKRMRVFCGSLVNPLLRFASEVKIYKNPRDIKNYGACQ